MSRPENVRVECYSEFTVNLGNFENVKPGFRVSADVPDGVHPTEIKDKLQALVDEWLGKEVEHYRSVSK